MAAQTSGSTISRKTLFLRVRKALTAEHGDAVKVPSDRELYRWAELLDQGRHTFGSATTRRTTDNRPDRPFTSSVVLRPGEQVQIDTNTVDVLCRYGDGVTRRAELTIAVDLATRSILTGVVAPSTKAVDAVAVLARLLVPQPLRPGWPEALLLARSVLPYDRLLSIDARFELAQALPVNLHGYVGSSVTMRGKDPAKEAVFTVAQLQDLFDEWVVAVWQNRPHETLNTVWGEGRPVSPNEAYAAMVARCGYVPIPRSTNDYVELLPADWRRINEEGVTFDNRVYDTAALNPYRRTGSGVTTRNGRWEVRYDPYDVTQLWVRNHHDGGWITATWVHRDLVRQPFSAAIYEHVRARTAAGGEPVDDAYIARRVAELLDPSHPTTQSAVEKRIIAKERNNPPRPAPAVPPAAQHPPGDDHDDEAATGPADDDGNGRSTVSERRQKRPASLGFVVFDPNGDDRGFR